MPKNVSNSPPVWVDYDRCKECELCIKACPMGVLCMVTNNKSIRGIKLIVDKLDYCTGCGMCEQACPDIAIHVLPSKDYDRYAKSSSTGKARQKQIIENGNMKPKDESYGGLK